MIWLIVLVASSFNCERLENADSPVPRKGVQ
jgi:hypothetical protein